MDRRAQMPGQIFVYILAIIVVGVIIAYGYTAISDFSERGEQVAFVSFKTAFENTVKTMVSDYGTIKRPDFTVPKQYRKVCVTDFSPVSYTTGTFEVGASCAPSTSGYEPVVCSAAKQGATQKSNNPDKRVGLSNVFLTPDGSDSFHVDNIKVKGGQGLICAPVKNGKIKMQFKSLGDSVEVSLYS